MSNPYADLPPSQLWRTAVTDCAPGALDPFGRTARIGPDDKIATMGSCFAQHLSRYIAEIGLNYFVAEDGGPDLDAAARREKGFGVFSARYGNVYTVRQALQLFRRAFGVFQPADDVWRSGGRFVDAFRPRIEPGGFASAAEARADAQRHLACVRRVFTESDWLIFTLGLTESWRAKADGAVYPLAPGVAGGDYDPARYAFVNASVGETIDDLAALIEAAAAVNPRLKIILTVSPVALVATYEPRHVLVSTIASKSILRAAADEAERRFASVYYFPSYEIITSPAAEGRYYADDLRQVNQRGVDHVMRVFTRHFIEPPAEEEARASSSRYIPEDRDVVCDEEELARAAEKG